MAARASTPHGTPTIDEDPPAPKQPEAIKRGRWRLLAVQPGTTPKRIATDRSRLDRRLETTVLASS